MHYELSIHAQVVIKEREIAIKWLEEALNSPDKIEPDLEDGDLKRYLKVIPENGGRVLRVVVNFKNSPIRVVTVFFDRAMKGKL